MPPEGEKRGGIRQEEDVTEKRFGLRAYAVAYATAWAPAQIRIDATATTVA
jgi:hypothetical protein